MTILNSPITIIELKAIAERSFGDMVKAVVDVDRKAIAIDAELHSDLEAMLLNSGSAQESLWGINLYPDEVGDDFIEFDSLINIRPWQNNLSRDVESHAVRMAISEVVSKYIER